MTEEEVNFCLLCGPLADAMDMLDAGNPEGAKALLSRILQRAQDLCERQQKDGKP